MSYTTNLRQVVISGSCSPTPGHSFYFIELIADCCDFCWRHVSSVLRDHEPLSLQAAANASQCASGSHSTRQRGTHCHIPSRNRCCKPEHFRWPRNDDDRKVGCGHSSRHRAFVRGSPHLPSIRRVGGRSTRLL
jgi:hypothetical protein